MDYLADDFADIHRRMTEIAVDERAARNTALYETFRDTVMRMTNATGRDLDSIAFYYSQCRETNEDDYELRGRLLHHINELLIVGKFY